MGDFSGIYVATALLLALLTFLIAQIKWNITGGSRMAPGPIQVPFRGSFIQLHPTKMHRAFYDLSLKYGPVMSLRFGQTDAVVLSDVKSINEALLSSKSKDFNGRLCGNVQKVYCGLFDPTKADSNEFVALGGIGVSQGEIWRENRKLAVSKLLSKHHLAGLEPDIMHEVECLISALRDALAQRQPTRAALSVDLAPAMRAVALNMTTSVSFARKFHTLNAEFFQDSKEGEEDGEAEEDNFSYADFEFPWIKDEKKAEKFIKYQESINFLRSILSEVLQDHAHPDPSLEPDPPSFVDSIIEAQQEGGIDNSETAAVSIMLDLMLAGSDSVSKSLSFLMLLLSRHPDVQAALQAELDTLTTISFDNLDALPYLDAVVNEASRLYPAAPLALPHVATSDQTISNFDIKAGTVIVPNIWAIQRDPAVWDRPDEFIPSRFISNPALKSSPNFAPFGIGARNCVGKYLGIAQLKAVLGLFFREFSVKSTNNDPIDDVMGLTLSPQPAKCIVTARLES